MSEDKQMCGLVECDWNKEGICSWSPIPYECPCWKSKPRYEDTKIVEWIPNYEEDYEEVE